MSVLVLGGAGYIGSHAVYKLIDQQYDVVVVDNLQTGHEQAIHPKTKFYKGDIRNKGFLREVFRTENIDTVLHFAANSLASESMMKPITEDMLNNVTSVYGEPKLTMEKMMKWCYVAYGFKYVSLRYFNVAGARESGEIGEDHSPETHLIPIVL